MADPWDLAIRWVQEEHDLYQMHKTAPETDDARTLNTPEEWDRIIDMYLHRARTLGLANPLGRQAMAKAASTALGYLESVFRIYGSLPAPGYPSGEKVGELGARR